MHNERSSFFFDKCLNLFLISSEKGIYWIKILSSPFIALIFWKKTGKLHWINFSSDVYKPLISREISHFLDVSTFIEYIVGETFFLLVLCCISFNWFYVIFYWMVQFRFNIYIFFVWLKILLTHFCYSCKTLINNNKTNVTDWFAKCLNQALLEGIVQYVYPLWVLKEV